MTGTKTELPPIQAVENVELSRYLGKWYEIASFPQKFQKDCYCSTAEYSLGKNGVIIVENRCRKGSATGDPIYIKGKAFVEKNSGNAKLKVQFFWPFRAKYWIIDLAKDYSYAVISHPNRQYLWILSRTKTMDPKVYEQITDRLEEKGFDLNKLVVTEWPQI